MNELNVSQTGAAVVIGAAGGIGAALLAALRAGGSFTEVIGFSRPGLDILVEASVAAAAATLTNRNIRLVIDATGFLHAPGMMPEKSFRDMSATALAHHFAVNAIGPALIMKFFLPLLPRTGKSVFATLSAKVGSIGDNQIGGWYAYRAAKAALNQLVHTAAIELQRTRPEAICVSLHPGTVATPLSAPFAKTGLHVRPPDIAAAELLAVISALTIKDSGGFFDYKGATLPW